MPDSAPPAAGATLDEIVRFLERVPSADARNGGEAIPARAVLDAYTRAVRELRAIAAEARGRIERSAAVVAEARDGARRRRRRTSKR